jgi:hypothetical protein
MKFERHQHYSHSLGEARRLLIHGFALPLMNAASALALGILVVYSDADNHKVLTGVLSAANIGGWLSWLIGSMKLVRTVIKQWRQSASHTLHPGFRLLGMFSAGAAVSWVGVLCLLAYGMLG